MILFAVFFILFSTKGSVYAATEKQGDNWYSVISNIGMTLKPERPRDFVNISKTADRNSDNDAMLFVFSDAGCIVMTNRNSPRMIDPESSQRKYILRYWIKTETNHKTGDYTFCYIRMQTPSAIGSPVSFPRIKFRFMDDWTHMGQVFTLDRDGLIGNIQFVIGSTASGLNLWLDDLFFTEVTDLSENEIKELLEDAQFKTIDKLELKEELVDRSPPVKGNKVWNSGFEAIADGGWGYPAHRMRADDFEDQNPHSGKFALKLGTKPLMHFPISVAMYKKHSFSVWVRTYEDGRRSKISLSINSWKGDYRFTKTEKVDWPDWMRVSISEVLMPVPSRHYWFEIKGENIVIDDVQVEEGDASFYQPHGGIEAALSMAAKAYIYDWGQSAPLHVHFANTNSSGFQETATVRVWNIFEKVVWSEEIQVDLGPGGRRDTTYKLPNTLRGAFCADIVLGNTVLAERVFSVLPKPKEILAEQSMLGDHLNFTEFNLWAARSMGTRWTRCHDGYTKIFKMYLVNPQPEVWRWNTPLSVSAGADDAVRLADKYGIKILGVLDEPPGWATGQPERERCRGCYPENWQAWKKYVEKVAGRYKDSINEWELFNEPSNPDKYFDLCRNTYPVLKTVLAEGSLVRLSSNPGAPMAKKFKRLEGDRYLDAASAHIYKYSGNG